MLEVVKHTPENKSLLINKLLNYVCEFSTNPSMEQDSGIHIPSVGNNTGSLPDLSGLRFATCLDDIGDADDDDDGNFLRPMRSNAPAMTQGSLSCRQRRSRAATVATQPLFLPVRTHAVNQFQVRTLCLLALLQSPWLLSQHNFFTFKVLQVFFGVALCHG